MIEAAVTPNVAATRRRCAKYLRENETQTIVGPIAFSVDERSARKPRRCRRSSARASKDKDVANSYARLPSKQRDLFHDKLKTGTLVSPCEDALALIRHDGAFSEVGKEAAT